MTTRPDYTTARREAGFHWSVDSAQGALREITGTPIREFNLNPEACIEAYRRGRPLIRDMFGEDVGLPGLGTPAVSYGHVNCLGSELLFPEGGEVAHTHIYGSLEEGLRALAEPVDFGTAGRAPFFLDFRAHMQRAFPGESVHFSFGSEGPITSAYELRGEGFFTDVLDDPPLARRFLRAVVDSVLDFHRWTCSLEGAEPISPHGAGLCDDLSSLIPPRLWRDFVVASWGQYFDGMTTGSRYAHVENLTRDHLPYLEEAGLAHYDPSISPKLTPRLVAEHCRVPFLWRLESFHCREMSVPEVEDFVYQAVADGANAVTLSVAETMCNPERATQVQAFIRAGKEAKRLFDEGVSRAEIGERVSPEGRQKLWECWCGYAGPKSSRGGHR
jgi:hypothetical protein